MQVGDLVAYPSLVGSDNSKLMLGVVTFTSEDGSGVTVHWANGTTMHHSSSWLIKVEAIQSSENR
jgi:hypothetical protein